MAIGRYAFFSPTDEIGNMTSDDQQFLDLVRKEKLKALDLVDIPRSSLLSHRTSRIMAAVSPITSRSTPTPLRPISEMP